MTDWRECPLLINTLSGLAEHWNKPAPDPQERNQ